ncbi:MAG: hypothetical protein Q8O57_13290 [Kiritimatiellota bacterium]|nr:hypothetical protein [Kiritimatiellota bacterium]
MSALYAHIPHTMYGDVRRLRVLAWAVVGVCLTRSLHYSLWGESIHFSQAQYASSHARRFARWLHNAQIHPQVWYWCLVRAVLQTWPAHLPLYLVLDTSVLPRGFILIRLSLIYRGRALPLTWRVIQHASTSVSYRAYRGLLYQACWLLPRGPRIVFLADRGFVQRPLFRFAYRQHWYWRVRLKGNTRVRLPDGRRTTVAALCPPPGHAHFYHGVAVCGLSYGPLHLALANPTTGEEPWYILTPDPSTRAALDDYALRFDIEEEFLDDKSGGFDAEHSELADGPAWERLFLIVAVATLHFTCVGTAVLEAKTRRWVDTHWDRGLSYLQIGWRWLRQQFRKHWLVLPAFTLAPAPDPEPALASRQAKTQAQRHWIVTTFSES